MSFFLSLVKNIYVFMIRIASRSRRVLSCHILLGLLQIFLNKWISLLSVKGLTTAFGFHIACVCYFFQYTEKTLKQLKNEFKTLLFQNDAVATMDI